MNLDTYTRLRSKSENQGFFTTYQGLGRWLWYFSWFGNAVLVFLGYFLFYRIISSVAEGYTDSKIINQSVSAVLSVSFMFFFELVKRQLVGIAARRRFISGQQPIPGLELPVVYLGTLFFIATSFWFSFSGSGELVSRQQRIETVRGAADGQVRSAADSVFNAESSVFTDENRILTGANRDLLTRLRSDSTNSGVQRRSLEKRIADNDRRIARNRQQIESLGKKRDGLLAESKKDGEAVASRETGVSERNRVYFLFLSALLEIAVVAGVLFRQYHNHRGMDENRGRLEKVYLRRKRNLHLLSVLYRNGQVAPGDPVSPPKTLHQQAATGITPGEATPTLKSTEDFYSLLKSASVIEVNRNGSRRVALMDYHQAQNTLEKTAQ